MHPHPQIEFELARTSPEELFGAADPRRRATADSVDRYSLGRLAELLRLGRVLAPAPAPLDTPCGYASHS